MEFATEYMNLLAEVKNVYICVPRISRFLRFSDENDLLKPFDIEVELYSNDPTDLSLPKIQGEVRLEKGIRLSVNQVFFGIIEACVCISASMFST